MRQFPPPLPRLIISFLVYSLVNLQSHSQIQYFHKYFLLCEWTVLSPPLSIDLPPPPWLMSVGYFCIKFQAPPILSPPPLLSCSLNSSPPSSSPPVLPLSSCLQRRLIAPNNPKTNFSFMLAWFHTCCCPHCSSREASNEAP